MRKSFIDRKTKETEIKLTLNIDGEGDFDIRTGIGFFDHMLSQLAHHSSWDLDLEAKGDLDVDFHHTVEDVGICLGLALKDAIGSKEGLKRFGWASVPMDEALADVSVDISGRGCLVYNVSYTADKIGNFDVQLIEEFFRAFSTNAGITLHINVRYGVNSHHIAEAIFKAVAYALKDALRLEGQALRSTKGVL